MAKAKTEAEAPEAETTEDVPDNTLPATDQRMYFRSRDDGHLFAYHEDFLSYPGLDLITEAEAYPERNVPPHVKDAAEDAPPVDLAGGITDETGAEKEPPTDPALAKQAAKGWPQ